MTATLTAPRPAAAPPSRRSRARLARLERPLLLAGLALITLHLLDIAFSGSATSALGVLAIVAVPAGWALAQPRLARPTRLLAGVAVGLLCFGYGVASHGLHVVNNGPSWADVTGVGMAIGGLLLIGSGIAAVAAPRRPRRPLLGWVAWAVGAFLFLLVLMSLRMVLEINHAPRWEIQEASLSVPHEEVTIGDGQSAWYVPSRNGAAVLVSHGSGGSRERVVAHIRMLARHGYGVLALDNPGNGESEGHSNGLGDNAQPGLRSAVDWLARRPDVDPSRIAAFGTSLGGEVLLEAAAGDGRIRAVVSDGAARPEDASEVSDFGPVQDAIGSLTLGAVRAVAGTEPAPSLFGLMPRIAPRPVLLIAGGDVESEVLTNRRYRELGGESVALWTVPRAGHTAGLRTHPADYEQRTIAFLDRTVG
jgi:pimeloyl-ACP methyl ester carboxylesterase